MQFEAGQPAKRLLFLGYLTLGQQADGVIELANGLALR